MRTTDSLLRITRRRSLFLAASSPLATRNSSDAAMSLHGYRSPLIGIYPYASDVVPTPHITEFVTWLQGRPLDLAVVFLDGGTWPDTRALITGAHVTQVVASGVNPYWSVPLTVAGTSLAQVAAGSNDADFLYLAGQINTQKPSGTIYLRIGWEFNGDWYPWQSAGVEADYIAAFRHVVGLFRSVLPTRCNISWVPNWSVQTGASSWINPELSWPGSAYVDSVGIDVYYTVEFDGTDPVAAFDYKRDAPYGLAWQVSWAHTNNKPLSIGEWGVNTDVGPPYITLMNSWLRGNNYAFHNYWDSNAAAAACQMSNNQYPSSSTRFISEFRSQ